MGCLPFTVLSVVAGGLVEMRGWGSPADGTWVASRASHRIGGQAGYVTEFDRTADGLT